MKTEKLRKTIIIVTIIFCVLYVIFAARPLSTELHLVPEWTEDISKASPADKDSELIPYKLGQNLGYFTPEGRISDIQSFPFKATVSDRMWATFGPDSEGFTVHDNRNQEVTRINSTGFPFIEEDRIFVFLPGGTSLARFDLDGNMIWKHETFAPITCFSSSPNGAAAGYADGTLVAWDTQGNIQQDFKPTGSSLQVISGIGINPQGSLVAAVSGMDRQRFIIAEKNGEHSKIIFHEYLDMQSSKQLLIKFSQDSSTVWYAKEGGLGIVDIEKLKSSSVKIPGDIVQIIESTGEKLVYILSRDGSTWTVTVLEPFDTIAATFQFQAETAFIQSRDTGLFIGKDSNISRLTVVRK